MPGDRILKTDGQLLDGVTVLAEELTAITYRAGGEEHSIAPSEVLSMSYGELPAELREAHRLVRDAKFSEAFERYGRVANESSSERGWIRAFAAIWAAEVRRTIAELEGKGFREARRLYVRFRTRYPTSRFVPRALWQEGRAALNDGKLELARDAFEGLARGAFGPVWAAQGTNGLAWVALRSGDAHGALELFQERTVPVSQEPMARMPVLEALRGKAAVLRHEGDFSGALETLSESQQDRLSRGAHGEVADLAEMAALLCDLGELLLDPPKGQKSAWEAAAAPFLKVLYFYRPMQVEFARALFGGYRCFSHVKGGEEAASLCRSTLTARYPASQWARRIGK